MASRLSVQEIQLLGGNRTVEFPFALNMVRGPMGSGKSTLVRLLRSLLASVPRGLPAETERVEALAGSFTTARSKWSVYRPLVTTQSAPVEVSRFRTQLGDWPEDTVRVPATGGANSYSTFMLNQLAIPAVSVPRARSEPTSRFTTVSFTDWLGYCIITGDEIDLQVFGHSDPFRDLKRRWVFEIAYGYYDVERAALAAELRGLELQLETLEGENAIREKFLSDARWRTTEEIDEALTQARAELAESQSERASIAARIVPVAEVGELRAEVLRARARYDAGVEQIRALNLQIEDLRDLERQLLAQSSRLTRAIVSDEWMVDFDFVVCPRCGTNVSPQRGDESHCYLCLQPPQPGASREALLAEQDRVVAQQAETERLILLRERNLVTTQDEVAAAERDLVRLSENLERNTLFFVSDQAARIAQQAAEEARLEERITNLVEHRENLARHEDAEAARVFIRRQVEQVSNEIDRIDGNLQAAEENVLALEQRMTEYINALNIPQFAEGSRVKINRDTYLPEIDRRRFDSLSSQGLKTMVNVAHALAHHTVSIDRSLPIPGFLVLDGASANAGKEGYDRERVDDVYELIEDVSNRYADHLQIIAVDNEIPSDVIAPNDERIVLTLSERDRLIR